METLFAENESLSVELRDVKKRLARAEHRSSLLETNLLSSCSGLDAMQAKVNCSSILCS